MSRTAVKLERVAVTLSRGERDALRELAVRRSAEPRGVAWLPASACAIAVTQLSERYPLDLRDAVMPEASDRAAAERLAALSVWRDQLDAGAHPDPRVELMFSDEFARTARWLEERRRRRR